MSSPLLINQDSCVISEGANTALGARARYPSELGQEGRQKKGRPF
jgi:hypothetical protein